ncbi:MAG: hypothetical protein HC902_11330 [Calothrix sp. SM1_5_4]|nr:hypothetical protein [Calothrix sp. SM1_5_4]
MKFYILALTGLFFCLSCASKPTRDDLVGKVTKDAAPSRSIELYAFVFESSRPKNEIEEKITLDHGIQGCLRDALSEASDSYFSIDLSGEIGADGALVKPRAKASTPPAKYCLEKALENIAFGAGPKGRFKMSISRTPTGGHKGKSLLIDLGSVKKFE